MTKTKDGKTISNDEDLVNAWNTYVAIGGDEKLKIYFSNNFNEDSKRFTYTEFIKVVKYSANLDLSKRYYSIYPGNVLESYNDLSSPKSTINFKTLSTVLLDKLNPEN